MFSQQLLKHCAIVDLKFEICVCWINNYRSVVRWLCEYKAVYFSFPYHFVISFMQVRTLYNLNHEMFSASLFKICNHHTIAKIAFLA